MNYSREGEDNLFAKMLLLYICVCINSSMKAKAAPPVEGLFEGPPPSMVPAPALPMVHVHISICCNKYLLPGFIKKAE